ncbi:3-phosphoserine phosphatase [Syntrophotalea carbinolica DSM 2380]|uniref:Phosphoserine phosphatase n=1 Tax=Syntrophotalea carbinolica (strain DSM 2380 / NBRC 103641 / GraBd1) TaxID=338963 RepID=Q3A285_SYNC1|nr:phosphoserine phosphatase SerB [Syntrophotalea carbinolica]ABA89522.1 3-phosphoserine phosphatase [Syntrophotalea carbinolica DSM 2380]
MEDKMVLVTMTGPDQAGIISAVAGCIAEAGARIRDIEQSVAHTMVSLSVLIDLPDGMRDQKPLLKELLFRAKELGLDLDFEPVDPESYRLREPGCMYVLTMLGSEVNAEVLTRIGATLAAAQVNIQRINKLTRGQLRCVELVINVPPSLDIKELTSELLNAGVGLGIDIALQKENLHRRAKRLVVLDMDSTLIQVEVIDELARLAGIGEQVADITHRAMNGELDFQQALRERVGLLKGLSSEALEEVYRALPFTPGAKNLIRVLRQLGFKTAVISGGFSFFTDRLKEELGLDYAYANDLAIENGQVTGEVRGTIVDGQRKAELLEEIARREGIALSQVIAIGDGANDLPMIGKAGLGVAFNAKARVREQAQYRINQPSLDSILYLLGIAEWEMAELEA